MDGDFDGLGGSTPKRINRLHVAAANMGEQGTDGDLGRRDGNIDGGVLHQIHVAGAVDDGNGLAHPKPLGQGRGQNIGLFVVGQGAEDVGVGDVLSLQQVSVAGVAAQDDDAVLQGLGQIMVACGIALDDGHLVMCRDALRQLGADITATGDYDLAIRCLGSVEGADEARNVGAGGQKENLVIDLDKGCALRHDDLATPENGYHSALRVGDPARQDEQ